LNLGPTDVAEAVANAVESVTPAAEAKEISMQAEADPSLTMLADGDRLQQVIWNLLANAVKFTPKGGQVSVRAYRQGSDVCICVADTGEGIPQDVLPHVFDPFRQADASPTRRHGGLGLGLAIVKQLVVAHGGTIRAESEGPGRGSKFVAALPAREAVPTIIRASQLPIARSTEGAATTAPRLDGLSILIVDDEEDTRDIVGDILRDSGAIVASASSGEEALNALQSLRADVIVSDIGMPEMDGYAFMRRVRSLPTAQGGRTPALALTAYAQKEDARRAFAAGFQMHVAKPVESKQLVMLIANLAGLPSVA
jgi:CheY-like chemotaxis protein